MKSEMTKSKVETPVENKQSKEHAPELITLMPLVDIVENDEGVELYFDVPGVNSKSVEIEVKDNVLSMNASSSLKRQGRPIVFKRSFQVSDGADVENICAKTQDGVLTLSIPKSERAKVHRIPVR